MGDMTSGGAPRIKNIVAYLQGLAGTVLDGKVRTNLRRSDGTEVGTVDNPLHVDIGGNVPDTVGLAKIGGADTAVGAGETNSGTLRVAVASNDVNLSAIKTATEALATALDAPLSTIATEATVGTLAKESGGNLDTIATATGAAAATLSSKLDIAQTTLRDTLLATLQGASTKDLTTLQVALDAVETAIEGTVKTSLQTSIPAGTNEIGGVNVTKVAGTAVSVGSGNLDAGTARITAATDDPNLSAIKTATESSATALDVSLSTVAKESTVSTLAKETGGNLDDIAASTSAASTTLSSQLDITLSALKDAILGTNTKDFSTLQTTVDAIKTAVDAIQAFRTTPVVTTGTGNGAIAVSYAPNKVFYLDVVTVHLSAAPTTAGDLTVTLDAADGAAYDTVLFRIDPSADAGATDIVFSPLVPIPCAGGDAIVVAYANANGVTHGTRIVARAV